MNARDQWALYLDPETHPDVRAEIGSDLAEHEIAALDRVGGILADEAVWGEPSPGVRQQLLAKARAERDSVDLVDGGGSSSVADGPQGSVQSTDSGLATPGFEDELASRRARRRRTGWIGGGLVAAAAAVLAFLFVADPLDQNGNITTYEVAGTALAPDLDATVDVEPQAAGVAITLQIIGLAPAEEGTYYAAWLMPDMAMGDGSMGEGSTAESDAVEDTESIYDVPRVGIGSFHWRGGGIPIELWSGVDTDRFPVFMVTVQNEDDPPVASDAIVMTGRLSGR